MELKKEQNEQLDLFTNVEPGEEVANKMTVEINEDMVSPAIAIEDEAIYEKDLYTDEEAEIIAEENVKLVYFAANGFRSTGINIEELISVAFLGYAKAIKSFDKKRDVKFSTYAINCMKNEILFFLRKESKHRAKNISMNKILSTDPNGNPFELEDIIKDDQQGDVYDDIFHEERRDLLFEAIGRLSVKEQHIIIHRFGLTTGDKKTQKVISQEIDMSQANVSKLQKNAMDKLKRHLKKILNDKELTLGKALES